MQDFYIQSIRRKKKKDTKEKQERYERYQAQRAAQRKAEGEEEHVYKFKEIMQQFDDAYVPVIADLEFTKTTWGDKYECETI